MANGRFVSYLRVYTAQQGKSGLGLDAQRTAVEAYLNGGEWELVREVVEIESGTRNDRTALAMALRICRQQKATLIIAKLDRLARNAAFICTLLESRVEVVAADMPTADRSMLQMMAVFAEMEARAISDRTKKALAAAKERGTKLGGRRVTPERFSEMRAKGVQVRTTAAKVRAAAVLPVIEEIRAGGATTLRAIAAALNERNLEAPRGGEWHASQVQAALRIAYPASPRTS